MTTFLTTPKMSPELAARVEHAVRGKGAASRGGRKPATTIAVRLLVLLAASALVVFLVHTYDQSREDLERERRQLLARLPSGAELTKAQRVSQMSRQVLTRAATATPVDFVSEAVGNTDRLAAQLQRPLLFVRAPIGTFRPVPPDGSGPSALPEPEADTFLPCLREPPKDDREASMLDQVNAAHRLLDSRGVDPSGGVPYLSELEDLERFVGSNWSNAVRTADAMGQLRLLQGELRTVPLARGARAAEAELLVYLLDEPTDEGARSEFDGASPHWVRLGLVELKRGQPLLTLRLHADPGWISSKRRVYYARTLNACRLALEVRARLTDESAP